MIAVTFALPSESSDFRRLIGRRHREVKVLHTGVGATIARSRLDPFLDSQPFDCLISSGFAGGTDPALHPGDLFLAENYSDPSLLTRAREVVIGRLGKLVSVDRIIADEAERAHFAREHGAAAIDMETEWIARACAAKNIPMVSLRAISDTAAAPFPAPPSVLFDLKRQRTSATHLGGYLVTHPFAIVRLMRFARQIAGARARLAAALKTLLEDLD